MTEAYWLCVRIEPDGPKLTVTGRDAWALDQLIKHGERGITPLSTPGPRWSAYVFNLRAMGFAIETRHERHQGPFPGTHARYVLRSDLTVLEAANG